MNGCSQVDWCSLGRAVLSGGGLLLIGLGRPALAEEPIIPEAEAWLAAQPREAYDVEALAAKLTTPQEAFAYVRDQIAYEPYRGVMKGAAGALLTHGANDCDRALLLSRLLAAQGLEVKLVRATLPPSAVRALIDDAAARPDAIACLSAALPAVPAPPSDETVERKEFRQLFAQSVADRAGAIRQAESEADPVLAVAMSVAATRAAAPAPPSASHVWVQTVIDGRAVDLDASRADAKFGEAPAPADGGWTVDALPGELFHTVSLRLVEEALVGSGLERRELVAHDARAAETLGTGLRLAILPKTAPDAAGDYRPLVLVGDEMFEGTTFRLSGASVEPAAPAGPGGLLGGFGGGGGPEGAAKPAKEDPNGLRLAQLWVEVVFHAPGLPDETVRRMIIDRVEPQSGGWRLNPALADDRVVRPLLIQTWDAVLDVGAPHPLALLQAQITALKTIDPVRTALAKSPTLDPRDIPAPAPAPQLLGFFFASALKRHQLGTAAGAHLLGFLERPRLAFLRHGFVMGDWTNLATAARYREGIDLINAPIRFLGRPEAAAAAALRAGVSDTILELYTLNYPAFFNTVPLIESAQAQKVTLVTVAYMAQLGQISVPPAIRAVLADEIAKGCVLVAPAHPIAYAGTHAFGWGSLDPATGYAIGKMEPGGAQGLAEYEETNEKIAEWTETYVKFMGNVLKCYTKAVTDALVPIEFDQERLKVTASIAHGNNPMPDTSGLIDCLRDAVCDALKDFIQTEVNSAAILGEVEGLKQVLAQFAIAQGAAGGSGYATGKICNKLLGGGEKK